jgi:hypothetical protein
VLEAEAIQGAVLAAAGELQALVNHLGLASRAAPATRFSLDTDLRAFLRRAFQFGQSELVSVDQPLGQSGVLARPSDVLVSARTRVPQLAVELQWHPRGEDHLGFADAVMGDVLKMALAHTRRSVEQGAVLAIAPPRFWRWLPGFAEERPGYELLAAEPDTPVSVRSEFLAGPGWDFLFQDGREPEVPERLWTQLLARADVRSPWVELELRLLEVKGLGPLRSVR